MTKLREPMKVWQWVSVTAGVALLAAWLILYFASLDMGEGVSGKSVSSPTPTNEAKVKIDFGGGQKRAFQGAIIEGMSVYHALLASAKAGNLDVEVESAPEGSFVKKIDAVENDASAEWQYYLNGEPQAKHSVEERPVRPGDIIEFTYE